MVPPSNQLQISFYARSSSRFWILIKSSSSSRGASCSGNVLHCHRKVFCNAVTLLFTLNSIQYHPQNAKFPTHPRAPLLFINLHMQEDFYMLVTTLLVRPCHALLVTADSASADMAYTDLVSAETHREWTFPVLKDTQSVTQCCSATALIGSTMYQLGGATIDGNPVATVFSYNLNTMAVGPQLNSMPTARYNLGAVQLGSDLGNVVYAVGGRTLSSPTRDGMATTALWKHTTSRKDRGHN